jgi:hypothetical protein
VADAGSVGCVSAAVNNGIEVGPVTVLVREATRNRTAYEVVRDLAASLFFWQDVEGVDWLVSVHSNESREVVASRQFESRHRAHRARTDLVTVAEACDDLDAFDWKAALART